jgi:hypothetical protein
MSTCRRTEPTQNLLDRLAGLSIAASTLLIMPIRSTEQPVEKRRLLADRLLPSSMRRASAPSGSRG